MGALFATALLCALWGAVCGLDLTYRAVMRLCDFLGGLVLWGTDEEG